MKVLFVHVDAVPGGCPQAIDALNTVTDATKAGIVVYGATDVAINWAMAKALADRGATGNVVGVAGVTSTEDDLPGQDVRQWMEEHGTGVESMAVIGTKVPSVEDVPETRFFQIGGTVGMTQFDAVALIRALNDIGPLPYPQAEDEIWTTITGKRIPVGEMSEEHVRNVLRMLLKNRRRRLEAIWLKVQNFHPDADQGYQFTEGENQDNGPVGPICD